MKLSLRWSDSLELSHLFIGRVPTPVATIRRANGKWVWSVGLPGCKLPAQPAAVDRQVIKIAVENVVRAWFELVRGE